MKRMQTNDVKVAARKALDECVAMLADKQESEQNEDVPRETSSCLHEYVPMLRFFGAEQCVHCGDIREALSSND